MPGERGGIVGRAVQGTPAERLKISESLTFLNFNLLSGRLIIELVFEGEDAERLATRLSFAASTEKERDAEVIVIMIAVVVIVTVVLVHKLYIYLYIHIHTYTHTCARARAEERRHIYVYVHLSNKCIPCDPLILAEHLATCNYNFD